MGRDPEKPDSLIDTNEYVVIDGSSVLLTDPGGLEIFPAVLGTLAQVVNLENLEAIFASHQDPDIVSSLALWWEIAPQAEVYVSWIWGSFIPHFGTAKALKHIPDEGMKLQLGHSNDLELIPAHYMHSAGNFSLYDPQAKILFSGDIGAALLPKGHQAMYVESVSSHIPFMEGFHKRWMPSNRAKNEWVQRVRELDIDMLCPQHGSIFKGPQVGEFLDWLENLEVGSAHNSKS